MKAYLRSVRIAPKKANIIAKLVRGMPVGEAVNALKHTNKKGARMVEKLVLSAVANAEHNDKQDSSMLIVKTIVVNQAQGYNRGVPKARGSVRPITKFMSHISLTLGVAGDVDMKTKKPTAKITKKASQTAKNTVKTVRSSKKQKEAPVPSSESSESSISSESSPS